MGSTTSWVTELQNLPVKGGVGVTVSCALAVNVTNSVTNSAELKKYIVLFHDEPSTLRYGRFPAEVFIGITVVNKTPSTTT